MADLPLKSFQITSIRVEAGEYAFDLPCRLEGADVGFAMGRAVHLNLTITVDEITNALSRAYPQPPKFDTTDAATAWLDRYPLSS